VLIGAAAAGLAIWVVTAIRHRRRPATAPPGPPDGPPDDLPPPGP
jgi:hypothetical protein